MWLDHTATNLFTSIHASRGSWRRLALVDQLSMRIGCHVPSRGSDGVGPSGHLGLAVIFIWQCEDEIGSPGVCNKSQKK